MDRGVCAKADILVGEFVIEYEVNKTYIIIQLRLQFLLWTSALKLIITSKFLTERKEANLRMIIPPMARVCLFFNVQNPFDGKCIDATMSYGTPY